MRQSIFIRRLKCVGICALVSCVLLSCASTVRTTVSTFRAPSPLPLSGRVKVLPVAGHEDQLKSLEFKYFSERLARHLSDQGYVVTTDDDALLTVYLEYDTQRQEKNRRGSSVGFRTGFGYHYRYGSVVMVDDYDEERFEYVRRVKVSVVQSAGEQAPLLSLTGVSYGQCEHLSSVYDEILAALFSDMQRPSGSVVTVPVKASQPCAR